MRRVSSNCAALSIKPTAATSEDASKATPTGREHCYATEGAYIELTNMKPLEGCLPESENT